MPYVPQVDTPEAALLLGLDVVPVYSLASLAGYLRRLEPIGPYPMDISHLEGQA